jgi:polyisoprenoid-binding protein YceI
MVHPAFPRVVLLVVACFPVAVAAEPLVLRLDPAASTVSFTLDSTLHEVHGTMPLSAGAITFDPAGGPASGAISVDASRAETGNEGRDEKMHDEVLETKKHPIISFTPTRTEGALPADGSGHLTLVGTLDLHGASHVVTLPASVERRGDRVTASATLVVPYVAWGLEDPSVFVLRAAKEVVVKLAVVGQLGPVAVTETP